MNNFVQIFSNSGGDDLNETIQDEQRLRMMEK